MGCRTSQGDPTGFLYFLDPACTRFGSRVHGPKFEIECSVDDLSREEYKWNHQEGRP